MATCTDDTQNADATPNVAVNELLFHAAERRRSCIRCYICGDFYNNDDVDNARCVTAEVHKQQTTTEVEGCRQLYSGCNAES